MINPVIFIGCISSYDSDLLIYLNINIGCAINIDAVIANTNATGNNLNNGSFNQIYATNVIIKCEVVIIQYDLQMVLIELNTKNKIHQ